MALVTDTWTGNLAAGSPLDGTEVEGYLSALRAGINSIDDTQIAVGANIQGSKFLDASIAHAKLLIAAATGARFPLLGAAQRKMVYGKKAFTITNPNDEISVAITFAADGVDTPSAFANATDLVVQATIESTIVDTEELICDINTIAATGFNCVVRTAASGPVAANRSGNIHWWAIGRTA